MAELTFESIDRTVLDTLRRPPRIPSSSSITKILAASS
jgi:hypothetical protein